MSELAILLDLADRIDVARAEWRKVVALAATAGDDELASEVYIARAGLLGAAERLDELIETATSSEMEVA